MKNGSEFESSGPLFVGILEMETAFQTHALFSQDGVVMPNGRTPVLTRSFELQVSMPVLPLHWRSDADVSDRARYASDRVQSPIS